MTTRLRVVYAGTDHAHSIVHVGRRLRELREARGLTQEQAAVRSGSTRNTLAKHEAAAVPKATLGQLLALMELYEVSSLDELIGMSRARALVRTWTDLGRPGVRGEFLG